MDEVSFSGLVIILTLGSLVPQYLRCNSCKVSLMKTTAYIGIFWEVLTWHPSIFGCISVTAQQRSTHSALISALLPVSQAAEPGCWRCYLQLFLPPHSEGTLSQAGAGRWMSQELRGLSSFPALLVLFPCESPGFALSCFLTCDNAPDLFVEFSWLLGFCSKQSLCCRVA